MPPPSASPATTSAAMAAVLVSMSALCTLLPARAPKQLIAVSPTSAAAAIALSLHDVPVISRQ